ncbi:DNA replication initiation factor-like protein Cdc45 [Tothia fuscella]|uniref:DNA replication initiation factor-like protein Cdc45 n=1 Tax=Tothia fuscella TaxID=1048955 RepID=A0A9P4P458_9PEZI|nr:DNA replication initiation factor-like protein Cdc45 [Tothia fuscella]
MYLPRNLISHLYAQLQKNYHLTSPPVLILVSLDPDALCACRILTALFKRDYIQHKIEPISGYGDLTAAGEKHVQPMRTTNGGSGGIVVCLGVGGLVDLEAILGLEADEEGNGGMGDVEIWVVDARRPWNLSNVFGMQSLGAIGAEGELVARVPGVQQGRITESYRAGRGGIVVFDDGDIVEQLGPQRDAYCALAEMPELGEDDEDLESTVFDSDNEEERVPDSGQEQRKRKSNSDAEDSDSEADEGTPRKKRRSNSSSSIDSTPERPARRGLLSTSLDDSDALVRSDSPPSVVPSSPRNNQPSARALRRQLLRLRRKHDAIIQAYQNLGQSYSEPISAMMYSLASELGREDNDLLWHAIVGVTSLELSGRTMNGIGLSAVSTSGTTSSWNRDRGEQIRSVLRDEVRRLNPTDLRDIAREASIGDSSGIIQTHARGPTDNSIRLSPEPRFLLIRHWSLYDSMLHSPYLSAKLRIWNDAGKRRLHKLLAKMGVSLTQCKQSYTHMDMELKRGLRERLLRFAPQYGLEALIPPQVSRGMGGKEGWGFVRCWGWKACLSAMDVGVIVGAILEVGDMDAKLSSSGNTSFPQHNHSSGNNTPRNPEETASNATDLQSAEQARGAVVLKRFWTAYDALGKVQDLTKHIITAQHLHRAILRTGTSLLEKKQIRHLRSFRLAVVKEGPDVQLFSHPGALVKLALWVAEAITETESSRGRKGGELVVAGLDENRGVYVVVGLGGGADVVARKEKEQKRQTRRKAKADKKEAKKADRECRRHLKRERMEANGVEFDSEAESEDESEEDSESEASSDEEEEEEEEERERGKGLNRFGIAFSEAVEETGARVRQDSFEHCVVEVKKEDLLGFLEALSQKAVVG